MLKARFTIMLVAAVYLTLLGLTVGYAAFFYGGVVLPDWSVCVLAIGCITLGFFASSRHAALAPKCEPWIRWPLLLLPVYVGFQLIPVPLSWLRMVSPARAEVTEWLRPLNPGIHLAPISFTPAAAVAYVIRVCACIAVFLLVREMMWRMQERRWAVVGPLVIIASLEAVLGLLQHSPDGSNAVGTFVDRDHFAGLLEMALPFPIMYGLAVLRRRSPNVRDLTALQALIGGVFFALGALIFVGIIYSLSRMGFIVALATLFVLGALSFGSAIRSSRGRLISVTGLGLAIVLVFVFLPPGQLIARFADMASSEKVTGESRLHFWTESVPLIRSNLWFGVGLGGFESAFRRVQTTETLLSIDYVHNDYLQFLAELGLVGVLLLGLPIAAIMYRLLRGFLRDTDVGRSMMAIACVASITAILLHSFVDFNLQIPSNASIFAWILGTAAGVYVRAKA